MLRRAKHIKYVVLYRLSTAAAARRGHPGRGSGPITENDLVSVRSYLTPPSAFLSPYAKDWFFNRLRFHFGAPPSSHMPTLQLLEHRRRSALRVPEFELRYDRVDGSQPVLSRCPVGLVRPAGLTEPSAINANLAEFEIWCGPTARTLIALDRSHGAG